MQDRADPHARERAFLRHRAQESAARVFADEAVAEIRELLNSIGDTCPKCPGDA